MIDISVVMATYRRPKSIVADRIAMKREPQWFPATAKKGHTLTTMARFLTARDWRRRLGR